MKHSWLQKPASLIKRRLISGGTGLVSLFLAAAYLLGAAAGIADSSRDREKHSAGVPAAPASAEGNWGLSFQEEGETPVGNATFEYLEQYDAFYA